MSTGLRAFLLTSSDSGRPKVYPNGAIVWNESGQITFVGNWKNRPSDEQIRWEDQTGKLVTPGFIDILLGPRTIMGHAIHLSAREYRALAATDTKVAHCPSSNLFLRSGVMAYDRMRENRITVGLASDVAAGPELNPWEVMKAAGYGQNLRSCYVKNAKTFSPAELFHLATVSGAAVLGQQSEIGQLRKGFIADCALWDTKDLLPYRSNCPTNHPNWCHY